MNIPLCLLLLIAVPSTIKCAKILGVFPSFGYSQFILAEKLMTELARRGHEVTVISVFKPKEEIANYRTILVDGLLEQVEGDLFLEEDIGLLNNIITLYNFGDLLTEYVLSHEKVQKLIKSNEIFDLVIVEQFVNEAHMGFAEHFKAPLLLFCSIGLSEWTSALVGNVRLLSTEPLVLTPYTNRMNFFQRLSNSYINVVDAVYKQLFVFPQQQQFLDKYFPRKISLEDVMYNASLLLLNSHASVTHPTALTTAVVEVGGFHISPKKLPQNIQKFLDEAKDGAILFSLGSNLRTTNMPKNTLNSILKVFSKLKQRVLWKFDGENIPNKPKNLLISKWLPQTDILAHPNTVAFITHCGLLSTTEAVFYGVPMIGIPVFGDQKMNAGRSVHKGIAVYLPFKELSEDTLYKAVKEILDNPKYKENAKKYSKIHRDRPLEPLDLAMYWVEYVIRYGGAPHLRNSSLELYWFQFYLVDVICFVILSVVIFYYFVKLLLIRLFKILKNRTKEESIVSKQNKKQKVN